VNTKANLLARMLDLERSGGYQVDQQARHNLKLTPQYGGTVGAFAGTSSNLLDILIQKFWLKTLN
jgi:hypothetical protein